MKISQNVEIPDHEIEMQAIRAQGPGGQNVNKLSSAIHCRFDIRRSSLPEFYKQRLLALSDSRISRDGVIVIKAQSHRSQEKNRRDCLERLRELIQSAVRTPKKRIPTRPGQAAKRKRLDSKTRQGAKKRLRGKPADW